MKFIRPAIPILRSSPPTGDAWTHEVKFDGWRIQIHKTDCEVLIFSRNGADITSRFPEIAKALTHIGSAKVVIDAELTAIDAAGHPDFNAILRRHAQHTVWGFDLLAEGGRDLRELPLLERRRRLAAIVKGTSQVVRLSETFSDPNALLAKLNDLGIEGVVSKQLDSPYRSGTRCGWIKVKTNTWKEASRERWKRFQR